MIFFFNDTATTEIYTLSLHDALPICRVALDHDLLGRLLLGRLLHRWLLAAGKLRRLTGKLRRGVALRDRKSTRLNSSHANISYAVFCLKKKNISSLHHPLIIAAIIAL